MTNTDTADAAATADQTEALARAGSELVRITVNTPEAAAAVEEHFKRASDELRRQAHDLIEAKWPHVEAVAEALLERGALGGDEVRAIIAEVEATTARAPEAERATGMRSARSPR